MQLFKTMKQHAGKLSFASFGLFILTTVLPENCNVMGVVLTTKNMDKIRFGALFSTFSFLYIAYRREKNAQRQLRRALGTQFSRREVHDSDAEGDSESAPLKGNSHY
jgi:hypothetical protein